jgi:4'-phosphopantetheinyl transferase
MYLESNARSWEPQRKPLPLKDDEVHVWRASFASLTAHVLDLAAVLSPDERARALRFHFPQHRTAFIVARAVLRHLVGHYLALAPTAVRFTYNRFGKPFVLHGDPDLHFNLAHAGDVALYALARREVGIDVEQVRPDLDWAAVARASFSPAELAEIANLPASLRTTAFFHCWTCKEAYIKARGLGLQIPLDQFDVSCSPEKPAALRAVRTGDDSVERWSMRAVTLDAQHLGALVVASTQWHGRYWTYLPPA